MLVVTVVVVRVIVVEVIVLVVVVEVEVREVNDCGDLGKVQWSLDEGTIEANLARQ